MRILLFHGYLLSGTGSNVYNANLAQALRNLGHEVHLFSQDRGAAKFDWVDRFGAWEGGELHVADTGVPPAPGSVSAWVPDTGGVLPVFVRDRYAGFEVRTFAEMTPDEVEDYVERNAAAVREVVERCGSPDAALANHLVTAPIILTRAGIDFAVKVHGSDLSYTVLPEIERFGPMAIEGARAARGILVGSEHIAERLRLLADEEEVNAKVRQGPPGVDTDLFAPVEGEDAPGRLEALANRLDCAESGDPDSSWARDPAEAARAVRWLADGDGPRVVYVGKLIVSKGVDLLLAAWPLVHAAHPGSRLIVAGFGAYRDGLEALAAALGGGDIQGARSIADQGRGLEGGEPAPLRHLDAFLADPPEGYADLARDAAGTLAFSGRLEHEEVGMLVPACDALVFPSTHPEAFGMVAAEAAAAGVLPVSAAHSGALEVSRELAAGLPAESAGLVSFEVGDGAVRAIAANLTGWLALDQALRLASSEALRATAKRLWGWEGVAQEVIRASRGELSPDAAASSQ